jgi:hypothetical protein
MTHRQVAAECGRSARHQPGARPPSGRLVGVGVAVEGPVSGRVPRPAADGCYAFSVERISQSQERTSRTVGRIFISIVVSLMCAACAGRAISAQSTDGGTSGADFDARTPEASGPMCTTCPGSIGKPPTDGGADAGARNPDASSACVPLASVSATDCPQDWMAALADQAAFCMRQAPGFDAFISTGSCRGLLRYTRHLFDGGPRYCVYDPNSFALRGYHAVDAKAGLETITCGATSADFDDTGCTGASCWSSDASLGSVTDGSRAVGDAPSNDSPFDAPISDAEAACRNAATGNACVTCCAHIYSGGKAELDLVGYSCMCRPCSTSCQASTCRANAPPQTPCIACVKQSLANVCPGEPSWIQCSTSCHDYVRCVLSCAD